MGKLVALPNRLRSSRFPRRVKNDELRPREYLTESEVDAMIRAIRRGKGRNKLRDCVAILLGYRHGLRIGETARLEWAQFDLARGTLYVRRLKGGTPSTQPLQRDTMQMLSRLRRKPPQDARWLFMWGGAPIGVAGLHHVVRKAGAAAGIPFLVHWHMLRHGAGYALANKGVPTRTIQLLLGHTNLAHTARYTALSPAAFEGLWEK